MHRGRDVGVGVGRSPIESEHPRDTAWGTVHDALRLALVANALQRHRAFAKGLRSLAERLPVVQPDTSLAADMAAGVLEGIVLKDRRSTYRDGSRVGWPKVKDANWSPNA